MADHMTAVTAEQLRAALVAAAEQWKRAAAAAEVSGDSEVWMLCLRAAGQLNEVVARLSGMAADTWQPIETAPLDRRVELWIPWPENAAGITGYPTHGKWDRDQYSRRPRPFWNYDLVHRITDMRDNPPTHWRPESEPPHV